MMKNIWVLSAFFLFSCASPRQCDPSLRTAEKPEIFADSVNRSQLIGRWIGESKVNDGSTVKELIERRLDGTFLVYFKMEQGGVVREQSEAGLWGISGGIYFTLTRAASGKGGRMVPVDVKNASFYDAYKALSISPSAFTYKSLATGEEFTVNRVGDSFKF